MNRFYQYIKAKATAFSETKFGHAVEHALTAAGTTAAGLLVARYFTNHAVTLADARDAWAVFVSGAGFGLRTAWKHRNDAA